MHLQPTDWSTSLLRIIKSNGIEVLTRTTSQPHRAGDADD
jgi:hypothetical protein